MPLTNWAGNVTFSATTVLQPSSIAQLQHTVTTTERVRALGTGHSFNRVADTTGVFVSVADLGTVDDIVIDAAAGTATVPAGLRYGDVGPALHAAGWALANLGSLPHISLAGACATGTHGSGVGNQGLAAAVVAIEFVDGTGRLVRVAAGDEPFAGTVLSLGLLGVATRLTLAVEPTYAVRQDVWLDLPWAELVAAADEVLGAGYSVSVFSEFRRPGVADKLWIKTRLPAEPADGSVWGARSATQRLNPVEGHHPGAATTQLGVPGPWHTRLPHFRLSYLPSSGHEQQSEYLVPREHTAAALEVFGAIGPSLRPALEVAEIRTVAADPMWLSPAHHRDSLALHVTWIDDDAQVAPALARLEAALAPFDPRPHWGKVFAQPAEQVRAHYPALPAFRELVARHDPAGRFVNDFARAWVL